MSWERGSTKPLFHIAEPCLVDNFHNIETIYERRSLHDWHG
jgi:hypothetical protein